MESAFCLQFMHWVSYKRLVANKEFVTVLFNATDYLCYTQFIKLQYKKYLHTKGSITQMSSSGVPITPNEVDEIVASRKQIPTFVFDAFNELIILNMQNGTARFSKEDVFKKLGNNSNEIEGGNVEDAYRAKGWFVNYDKIEMGNFIKPTYTFCRK